MMIFDNISFNPTDHRIEKGLSVLIQTRQMGGDLLMNQQEKSVRLFQEGLQNSLEDYVAYENVTSNQARFTASLIEKGLNFREEHPAFSKGLNSNRLQTAKGVAASNQLVTKDIQAQKDMVEKTRQSKS